MLKSKLALMVWTWLLALLVSFGLRLWGHQHPEPFMIRGSVVAVMLVAPVIALGAWVSLVGFASVEERNSSTEASKDV